VDGGQRRGMDLPDSRDLVLQSNSKEHTTSTLIYNILPQRAVSCGATNSELIRPLSIGVAQLTSAAFVLQRRVAREEKFIDA
jgi:hypothetical protein